MCLKKAEKALCMTNESHGTVSPRRKNCPQFRWRHERHREFLNHSAETRPVQRTDDEVPAVRIVVPKRRDAARLERVRLPLALDGIDRPASAGAERPDETNDLRDLVDLEPVGHRRAADLALLRESGHSVSRNLPVAASVDDPVARILSLDYGKKQTWHFVS